MPGTFRNRCEDAGIARPTSKDVAARAGVSQSAVSLVLSGKGAGRVAPAKADAIRAAAAELGYRPNAAARILRTGAAGAVGLVVPDVTNPFFGLLLGGAQAAARETGTAVVLLDTGRDEAFGLEAYERLRAGGAVDGVLWFATAPPAVGPGDPPLVLVEAERRGVVSVRFAVEDGFRAIGEHLRELGHRDVVHAAADAPQATFAVRAEALAEGLGFTPRVVTTEIRVEAAREALRPVLAAADRPTAVVGEDDLVAAGAVLAARDVGLRIPEDLSIAGHDDLDLARVTDPPLTTVRLDGPALGATAFRVLHDLVGGRPPARRRTVLPVEPVLRGSTGPAPRRRGRR